MLHKLLGILLIILIVVAIICMIYGLGSAIVKDYINNGLFSVILSFIVGTPILYILVKLHRKFEIKF